MADILLNQQESVPNSMVTRYRDMGDGSWALVVSGPASGLITTQPAPVRVQLNPTISAGAAYAAGDALGGRLAFEGVVNAAGGGGTITKVVISDRDGENPPIDLVLFDQPFTATADNAAFDPSDADLDNCLGYIDIAATDYATFNDNAVAAKASGLRMPFDFRLAAGASRLMGQMVIREAITFTAIDDIAITLTVIPR
jgi:hypothetical protein